MVRLEAFGDRKPAQLSGGQRQRVALARALVNRPKVLLLDEPLGALDLKLRQAMQIELKEIQQAVGLTFIYVTHDQEEALTMSDRLAVFNRGRIEQVGTPAEVYERPGDGLRGGVRRRVERPRRRGRARDHRRRRTRSRSGRRRSRWCEPDAPVGPDECSATGHVREVVYLGAMHQVHRRARRGRELVVMQQNLDTSSMEALQVRGKAVRLVWEPREQPPGRSAAGAQDGSIDQEEGAR